MSVYDFDRSDYIRPNDELEAELLGMGIDPEDPDPFDPAFRFVIGTKFDKRRFVRDHDNDLDDLFAACDGSWDD